MEKYGHTYKSKIWTLKSLRQQDFAYLKCIESGYSSKVRKSPYFSLLPWPGYGLVYDTVGKGKEMTFSSPVPIGCEIRAKLSWEKGSFVNGSIMGLLPLRFFSSFLTQKVEKNGTQCENRYNTNEYINLCYFVILILLYMNIFREKSST